MTEAIPILSQCNICTKTQSDAGTTLKLCAKCQTTYYCSRGCQKADWKQHKKVCASNAASAFSSSTSAPRNSPSKGLIASVEKPFHRLDTETWLHGRPEEDVYKLLIDTYRLRMDDDYKFDGEADTDSIYGGALDGRQGFQCFLRTAHRKRHLLPPWWSQEKAAECVGVGMKKGKWSDLACTIEKSDIIEHYGSPMMPMQLRMFGEQIYGRGPGGQSGASMLKLQKMAENGGDGLHMSHLDLRSAFART